MIYLDCGFYRGVALKKNIEDGVVTSDCKVYVWEPNPEFNIKELVKSFPVKIKAYDKAVWIKDGKMNLNLGAFNNAASIIVPYKDNGSLEVKTMDFSKFVSKLPDDYILCNMDIEGAEFDVLEKMIKDGTIKKINKLEAEFHDRLVQDKTEDDTRELMKRLEENGVEVVNKLW